MDEEVLASEKIRYRNLYSFSSEWMNEWIAEESDISIARRPLWPQKKKKEECQLLTYLAYLYPLALPHTENSQRDSRTPNPSIRMKQPHKSRAEQYLIQLIMPPPATPPTGGAPLIDFGLGRLVTSATTTGKRRKKERKKERIA